MSYLGIRYHLDPEDSGENYFCLASGSSKEETKAILDNIWAPDKLENYKYFEYGKDVDSDLHNLLDDAESWQYWYNELFYCDEELENILSLNFRVSSIQNFNV